MLQKDCEKHSLYCVKLGATAALMVMSGATAGANVS